jgi:hypothetical protein
MATNNIYQREMARRKALWELARFAPGDPMAESTLAVLDDIDAQDSDNSHLAGRALSMMRLPIPSPKRVANRNLDCSRGGDSAAIARAFSVRKRWVDSRG